MIDCWLQRIEAYVADHDDPALPLLMETTNAILGESGMLEPAIRRAAFTGDRVAEEVDPYLKKVRNSAYRVTDDDVLALTQAGWSDDEVFELTLAAAAGAAFERLVAGLSAIGELDYLK